MRDGPRSLGEDDIDDEDLIKEEERLSPSPISGKRFLHTYRSQKGGRA